MSGGTRSHGVSRGAKVAKGKKSSTGASAAKGKKTPEYRGYVGSSQESKHKSREKVEALIQLRRGKEEGEWYIHVE
jgi:hypothetical protein